MDIKEQLEELIAKRARLNELKEKSAELAEAIELAESYEQMLNDLTDQIVPNTPQVVPMPYPVPSYPPFYPSQPTWIKITSTTETLPFEPYKVIN